MIEINLLPASGAARRPAKPGRLRPGGGASAAGDFDPRVAALGAAGLAILLLGAFGFWTVGNSKVELEAQVQVEEADSLRLARAIDLMNALDTRRDTIERKIDVIRQVDTRRYVWPHLMDEVSRATPQFTWLTRLASTEAPAPPVPADSAAVVAPSGPAITIEGNAGSTGALTRFMKNLETSPMIREVSLVTSEQTDVQGRTLLKFTLEARWEEPDSSFIESVPVLSVR